MGREPYSIIPSKEFSLEGTLNASFVRSNQLNSGKEWLGLWSIDVSEILTAVDKRAATIYYKLSTEKEGDLVVIVILHFDSNYMINEINEVHNRLEK